MYRPAAPPQVTDSHDRVTLMTILSSFYNHQLVEAPSYSLAVTTTVGYTAPPHTDLKVSSHATAPLEWHSLYGSAQRRTGSQRRKCMSHSQQKPLQSAKVASNLTVFCWPFPVCLLQGYLDYINALPHVAPPGVFGLHDNADITKDLQEAQQLLDGLLLSQSTSTTSTSSAAGNSHSSHADAAAGSAEAGGGDAAAEAEQPPVAKSREDVIAEIAADILAQLPPVFDVEAAEAAYPQDYFNSMNTVLVQVRFGVQHTGFVNLRVSDPDSAVGTKHPWQQPAQGQVNSQAWCCTLTAAK